MGRILVTGAAGFIAHRVCQILLSEGHTVVGVDNMNDAYDARLKKWHLAQITPYKKFTFHHLDVSRARDLSALASGKEKFDAVIKLGSPSWRAILRRDSRGLFQR